MTGPGSEGLGKIVHIFKSASFKLGEECTTLCGLQYVPTGLESVPTCEACETALGKIMAAAHPSSPVVPPVGAVPVEVPEDGRVRFIMEHAADSVADDLLDLACAAFYDGWTSDGLDETDAGTCKRDMRAVVSSVAARVRAERLGEHDALIEEVRAARREVARVRAEERQRIAPMLLELHRIMEDAIVRGGYREGEAEHVERLMDSLAAGSAVPVATPEPEACCSNHRLLGSADPCWHPAAVVPFSCCEACPSYPVERDGQR